jgi:hypothetical protein
VRHADNRQRPAVLLETPAGIENGLVLRCSGDDVIAAIAKCASGALDGQVVRLGRAAREHDLAWRRVYERSNTLACGDDRFVGFPSESVLTRRGVAESFGEVRQHGLEHAWIDRSRSVVIEVDRPAHDLSGSG